MLVVSCCFKGELLLSDCFGVIWGVWFGCCFAWVDYSGECLWWVV